MNVSSSEFIALVLAVSLVYFIIPRKARAIWLLLVSLAFYALWSVPNLLLLLASAMGTYAVGLLCQKYSGKEASPRGDRRGKIILAVGILALLAELFVFKYLNFTQRQVNRVLAAVGTGFQFRPVSLVMPVGVSFFVFQSIGYMVDVYRGKTRAERNVPRFLLFITFFPKIIQGPIERSNGFLRQIGALEDRSRFDYRRVTSGMITALWGFFLKLVIADRIMALVDRVFASYYIYGTVELALGAICYAIQIYCDFAGYSAIAVGTARIFGFDLIQNFDCPYFSASTREFWKRWHISLSTWFRDYVYIPLGGNRCSKWRKRLNTMAVMLVSGIWHGAGWTFIAWGLIHGAYQVMSDVFTPSMDRLKQRLHMRTDSASYRIGRMLVTFALVDLAWIFFRADRLGVAVDYIRRMFTHYNPWALSDGSLLKLGLASTEMNVLVLAMLVLIVVDVLQYIRGKRIDQLLENQCLWFKWGVIILLFTATWVYGMYGPEFNTANFIYQSF